MAHQLEALRRVSDKGICSLAVLFCLLAGCSNVSAPGANLGGGGEASFWLPYTTEDDSVVATYGPEIAIDSQGGIHISYTITAGQDAGHRPAYYVYCPSSCSDPQNWRRTRLGDDVAEVRLQLNPSGQPRIMLYVDPSTGPDGMVYSYQYAACDGGCEDRARWTITPLTTSHALESYRSDYTNHYFALDQEGRPGFVYIDFNSPDNHDGTFYAFCPKVGAACTNAANWYENKLGDELLWNPDLSYTPKAQPRVLAHVINMEQNLSKLVYIECDATCNQSQVRGSLLYDSDGYARYSLRLNSKGQPRVVYYSGFYPNDLEPQQLYYLSCDGNCADARAWGATNLRTSGGNGWYVDLQLDQQDRPRFVYKMGDVGPGYAWCDADCESGNSGWQSKLVEDRAVLERDFPVMPIVDCSISSWTSGHLPKLALDPQGNPHIAFVAMHQYAGTDTRPGHYGEPCPVQTDIKLVRFSMFPQP